MCPLHGRAVLYGEQAGLYGSYRLAEGNTDGQIRVCASEPVIFQFQLCDDQGVDNIHPGTLEAINGSVRDCKVCVRLMRRWSTVSNRDEYL